LWIYAIPDEYDWDRLSFIGQPFKSRIRSYDKLAISLGNVIIYVFLKHNSYNIIICHNFINLLIILNIMRFQLVFPSKDYHSATITTDFSVLKFMEIALQCYCD